MTAATTCSSTSRPSSAPDLERCVKVRRSPTRSLPIAALASLRPTICAPPAKQDFAQAQGLRNFAGNETERPRSLRGLFVLIEGKFFACHDVGQGGGGVVGL